MKRFLSRTISASTPWFWTAALSASKPANFASCSSLSTTTEQRTMSSSFATWPLYSLSIFSFARFLVFRFAALKRFASRPVCGSSMSGSPSNMTVSSGVNPTSVTSLLTSVENSFFAAVAILYNSSTNTHGASAATAEWPESGFGWSTLDSAATSVFSGYPSNLFISPALSTSFAVSFVAARSRAYCASAPKKSSSSSEPSLIFLSRYFAPASSARFISALDERAHHTGRP